MEQINLDTGVLLPLLLIIVPNISDQRVGRDSNVSFIIFKFSSRLNLPPQGLGGQAPPQSKVCVDF